MTRSRTVITALSVVSVLALGACSGSDPQPKFADPTPTVPSSPSTTAVSGPVEPTMPAAARGTDAAAAEAFVKFYWEMVNYAQATGDLHGLRQLSSPKCVACQGGIDGLMDITSAHGVISGGVGRVSHAEVGFIKDHGTSQAVVEFVLSTSRQVVNYPGRANDKVFPAGRSDMRAVLGPAGDGWTMVYWSQQ